LFKLDLKIKDATSSQQQILINDVFGREFYDSVGVGFAVFYPNV